MAICKTCGRKYSKFTTPVSARGVCRECFFVELGQSDAVAPSERVTPAPIPGETPLVRNGVPIRLASFISRSRSKVVFAIAMACYGWTLGSLIGVWARALHVANPPPAFYWATRGGPAENLVGLLVFAPLVESLLLIGVRELLRLVRAPTIGQVLVPALFISEMHVWPWWPRAILVAPAFCIQAASYLYWCRSSRKVAYWIVVLIHALNNSIPALAYIGYATRHT